MALSIGETDIVHVIRKESVMDLNFDTKIWQARAKLPKQATLQSRLGKVTFFEGEWADEFHSLLAERLAGREFTGMDLVASYESAVLAFVVKEPEDRMLTGAHLMGQYPRYTQVLLNGRHPRVQACVQARHDLQMLAIRTWHQRGHGSGEIEE